MPQRYSDRLRHGQRAFSLIELLVVISVVSVLLAILIPTLAASRRKAEGVQCLTILRGLGQTYGLYASDHNDEYPLILRPGDIWPITVEWGFNGFDLAPVVQVQEWSYTLREYLTPEGVDVELSSLTVTRLVSCPTVYRDFDALVHHDGTIYSVPMSVAGRSYAQSPALFTPSNIWADPAHPADVNKHYAPVKASGVAHPSSKSNLVETVSYHASRRFYRDFNSPGVFNTLACDGHVEAITMQQAKPTMGFLNPWGDGYFNYEQPSPLIGTIDGYLGRDW